MLPRSNPYPPADITQEIERFRRWTEPYRESGDDCSMAVLASRIAVLLDYIQVLEAERTQVGNPVCMVPLRDDLDEVRGPCDYEDD